MSSFLTTLPAKLIGAGLVVLLIAGLWLRGERFEAQRDKERAAHAKTVRRVKVAQDEALAAAVAARNAAEARYAALARKADHDSQAVRQTAHDASSRFLASAPRCVRAEAAGGSSGRTPAAAPDRGAGVPARLPAAPDVAVSEHDVRTVADLAGYALSCRSWAMSLKEN